MFLNNNGNVNILELFMKNLLTVDKAQELDFLFMIKKGYRLYVTGAG